MRDERTTRKTNLHYEERICRGRAERITDVYKQHMKSTSFCWQLMNENKQTITR